MPWKKVHSHNRRRSVCGIRRETTSLFNRSKDENDVERVKWSSHCDRCIKEPSMNSKDMQIRPKYCRRFQKTRLVVDQVKAQPHWHSTATKYLYTNEDSLKKSIHPLIDNRGGSMEADRQTTEGKNDSETNRLGKPIPIGRWRWAKFRWITRRWDATEMMLFEQFDRTDRNRYRVWPSAHSFSFWVDSGTGGSVKQKQRIMRSFIGDG